MKTQLSESIFEVSDARPSECLPVKCALEHEHVPNRNQRFVSGRFVRVKPSARVCVCMHACACICGCVWVQLESARAGGLVCARAYLRVRICAYLCVFLVVHA